MFYSDFVLIVKSLLHAKDTDLCYKNIKEYWMIQSTECHIMNNVEKYWMWLFKRLLDLLTLLYMAYWIPSGYGGRIS